MFAMRAIPKNLSDKLRYCLPFRPYSWLVNAERYIRRQPTRIRLTKHSGIFEIYDMPTCRNVPGASIFQCRRFRQRLYGRGLGVQESIDKYAGWYHLDKVPLQNCGIFVDCGANVGELGVWARKHNLRYVAFEPEPLDATCCDLNNFEGMEKTIRKALWNTNKTMSLFSKPERLDSSLIEMKEAVGKFSVHAVRLDGELTPEDLGVGTRIFKVEAEGAEPEVLQGAGELLWYFDFVVVNCGPERGKLEEYTFVEVIEILQQYGYKLLFMNWRMTAAMFANNKRRSGD